MEIFGKSPVPLPVLILGKFCFSVCLVFIVLQYFDKSTSWMTIGWIEIPSLIMIAAGTAISLISLLYLGESARVGLPTDTTNLKTGGLYRFSRNPIYFSLFLVCIGSSLYCLHPFNVLAGITAILIHHSIILREESFLESRFGIEWLNYKNKVRRYL